MVGRDKLSIAVSKKYSVAMHATVIAAHGVRTRVITDNVASKGQRLLATANTAMLTSAVLGLLCFYAYCFTPTTCDSHPIPLRIWFQVMYIIEGLMCVGFCCIHCGITVLMSKLARQLMGSTASPIEAVSEPAAVQDGSGVVASTDTPLQCQVCAVFNVMCATFWLAILTAFLFCWCFAGMNSSIDAGQVLPDSGCSASSQHIAGIVSAAGVFQICCCNMLNMADTHAGKRVSSTSEV